MLMINKHELKQAVNNTMLTAGGRAFTVYSPDSMRVLSYFEHTLIKKAHDGPGFKKSEVVAHILEDMVASEYPEIWHDVCLLIQPNKSGALVRCPKCKTWHTIGTVAENVETQPFVMPVLGEIDYNVVKAVELEIKTKAGKLMSVYNPRVSAVMKYLSYTETKFAVSRAAADLLETGLAGFYPEFFEEDVD